MRKRRSNIGRLTHGARRARAKRAQRTEEEILKDNEKSRLYSKFKISQETEEERRERLAASCRRNKLKHYSKKNTLKLQRINEIIERVKNDTTIKNNKKKQFSKDKTSGKEGFMFPKVSKQWFDVPGNTMYQLQYSSDTVTNMPNICQMQCSTSSAETTATATSPNTDLSEVPTTYWNHIDIKSECEENQWMNGTQMIGETNNIDEFSTNSLDGSHYYQECQNTPEPNIQMENESIVTEHLTNQSPITIEIKPEIMDNLEDESYVVPDNEINIQYNTEINSDVINTFQNILQYNTETNYENINCNMVQRMIYNIQNCNGTNGTLQRLNGTGLENDGSISEKIDLLDKTSVDPLNLMVINNKKKQRQRRK